MGVPITQSLLVKFLGLSDYQTVWQQMQDFTTQRDSDTRDELWFVEHPPVFTQGLAGKAEHVLNPGDIPIIQTDRGGQVTYHGPGQIVAYFMLDLRRLNIGIRQMVRTLEQSVIDVLTEHSVTAHNRIDAPGIYVDGAKICSIGLRVRKGCSYHGIAFNIKMDLTPFSRINPCGFHNLRIVQLSDFNPSVELPQVQAQIAHHIKRNFGYTAALCYCG